MSAGEPVTVVVRWQLASERVDEVLAMVAELRRQSLAEPGCLGYEVFRSAGEPSELLLLERYRDSAAIEAHRHWAHYRDLVIGRIVPMLSGRQVELLQPLQSA